jgi:hypothetical protein
LTRVARHQSQNGGAVGVLVAKLIATTIRKGSRKNAISQR